MTLVDENPQTVITNADEVGSAPLLEQIQDLQSRLDNTAAAARASELEAPAVQREYM